PVIETAHRHVVEWAFSFDIAGDPSAVKDGPRAGSAIDFCHSVVYEVGVVFRAASLWKLRRYCWSRAKRKYDSHRSEHRFHGSTLLQGHPFLATVDWRSRASDVHVSNLQTYHDVLSGLSHLLCGPSS